MVVGIQSIKSIKNFGNFDSEKVAQTIEDNKDIILKVQPYEQHDEFCDAIDIYLNLKVKNPRLHDGIMDMYKKFHATSVDLEYNKTRGTSHGIRILRFWWERHDRFTNI